MWISRPSQTHVVPHLNKRVLVPLAVEVVQRKRCQTAHILHHLQIRLTRVLIHLRLRLQCRSRRRPRQPSYSFPTRQASRTLYIKQIRYIRIMLDTKIFLKFSFSHKCLTYSLHILLYV